MALNFTVAYQWLVVIEGLQQGTKKLKVSWYMALFFKFVSHLPAICCI
ncbi:MAG: hypothetical protein KA716_32295 [Gloeotrichia echinulata DEX184]